MNIYLSVVLIPAAGALLLMLLKRAMSPVLWITALAHGAASTYLCLFQADPALHSWIGPDAPGKLFLCITSGLFIATTGYTAGFLRNESKTAAHPTGISTKVFAGCFLMFISAMSLACVSRHLGLYWVAIETTTLVSAPLITLHRDQRSLEAAWKYLLICSVGIAIALLGIFFLATAAGDAAEDMTMSNLIGSAGSMDKIWIKAAFILLLVGFGTKMGLAPMHTWLPDAHSEAPSMASALLSGALLNCAFLGILRCHAICIAAGLGDFSGDLLVQFGLLSMVTAGIFIIRQTDYTRMLAYSSIEHMGILALGIGTGGLAATGALFHTITHASAKAMLFLAAGNIATRYKTKNIASVRGAFEVMPVTAILWLGGIFAIAGTPPSGVFISEFIILKGLLESGGTVSAVLYLLTLAVVFTSMTRLVIPMVFGTSRGYIKSPGPRREKPWSVMGPVALALILIALGLTMPEGLWHALSGAAAFFGGPR